MLWSRISFPPGLYITETFTSSTFHCCPPCSPSRTRIFSNLDAESAPGSSSVDDKGRAGGGADDDEPSFESMGATNTLFVAKSRHTLLFLQPEHHKSWSFPLSLLQDFFFGLPLSRGTPKREVAATCAASSAKKAVSSMTLDYLLIQNDLRSLRRRRGCGKVHAPRQRRTSHSDILKMRSPCFYAACTRAHERLRIFTGKQSEIGRFGEN